MTKMQHFTHLFNVYTNEILQDWNKHLLEYEQDM